MKLAQLNEMDVETALNAIGAVFEHSPWVARLLLRERPFASMSELTAAVPRVLHGLPLEKQIDLIAAHPELGNRTIALTGESRSEQAAAGVDTLAGAQREQLAELNAAYCARFGFPFVICAREQRKETIAAALTARLMNERDDEIRTALGEIAKIATLRLLDIVTEA